MSETQMKLTPWFTGDQKPVRKGVYQVKCGELGEGFARWLGVRWSYVGFTKIFGKARAQEFAESTEYAHDTDSELVQKWRGVMNESNS